MTASFTAGERDLGRHALVDAPGCLRAGPYSLAVQTSGVVFTSGQIGLDANTGKLVEGGFEAEVRQIFKNFAALLAAAELSFADVVKCNIYLTDVSNFQIFNEIYASHFADPFPARTTIGIADLPLGAKVEMEMILHRP
jgi:2-iminobutanoate/2-iminopropanoate deaminase